MEQILDKIANCLGIIAIIIGCTALCKGLAPVDEKEWKNETH